MRGKEYDLRNSSEGYRGDGRLTIERLFSRYDKLAQSGWQREQISGQGAMAYLSPKIRGKAFDSLWILGGIHGEESAGPNAFAEKIEIIRDLPAKHNIPVVFLPLANPIAYFHNWRYFNTPERSPRRILSVGDSEHLLGKSRNPNKPRKSKASSPVAAEITGWVLRTALIYQPFLVMDHHEDEVDEKSKHPDAEMSYAYAHGQLETLLPIITHITGILKNNGFPLTESGETRTHEKIHHGFVLNTHDGSIDELFAADSYFLGKSKVGKTAARAAITIETTFYPEGKTPLRPRIETHAKIIEAYAHFWSLLQKQQPK